MPTLQRQRFAAFSAVMPKNAPEWAFVAFPILTCNAVRVFSVRAAYRHMRRVLWVTGMCLAKRLFDLFRFGIEMPIKNVNFAYVFFKKAPIYFRITNAFRVHCFRVIWHGYVVFVLAICQRVLVCFPIVV
jgi:hypothetical protein